MSDVYETDDYLRWIAESAERLAGAAEQIAKYLTQPDTDGPVMNGMKRRHYGEQSPQQEQTHDNETVRRPKQASRS